MKLKCVIFDFDGTLFDSMYLWDTVAESYVRSRGKEPKPTVREEVRALPGAVVDGQAGEVAGAGRRKSGSLRGQVCHGAHRPSVHAVALGPSEPSARARSS